VRNKLHPLLSTTDRSHCAVVWGTDVPRVPLSLTVAISAYTAEFALLYTADKWG